MGENFFKTDRWCLFFSGKVSEEGNSLIEVMVALIIFSLMIFSSSILFVSCKTLEEKALWQVIAHSYAFSAIEAGYLAKNDVAKEHWRLQLQKKFPGRNMKFQDLEELMGSKPDNRQTY